MGIVFALYFGWVLPAPTIAGWLADLSGNNSSALASGAILFAITDTWSHLFIWLYPTGGPAR